MTLDPIWAHLVSILSQYHVDILTNDYTHHDRIF